MTTVLLTGAAGHLGHVLTAGLADRGYRLRLSDVAPLEAVPEGHEFVRADLADKVATLALCDGVDVIVHFGAISGESDFENILDANIRGTCHIFDGARINRARVVFASTNHTTGFHERREPLTEDCHFRPDTFYGLSKAYGELLARYYWDKHGVESALLRIGSCFETPSDQRQLKTWLSFRDLTDLVSRCIDAPDLGCATFWGVSENADKWWTDHADELIGFKPRDSADSFADRVPPLGEDADPVAERYQGGVFCGEGYSRSEPSPRQLFQTKSKE